MLIQSGTFSSAIIGIRKLRLNKKEAYSYLRWPVIHSDDFILPSTLNSNLTDIQYRVLQFCLPLQKVYRTRPWQNTLIAVHLSLPLRCYLILEITFLPGLHFFPHGRTSKISPNIYCLNVSYRIFQKHLKPKCSLQNSMKSSVSICSGSWWNRQGMWQFLQMLFKMLLSPLDLFCLFSFWMTGYEHGEEAQEGLASGGRAIW